MHMTKNPTYKFYFHLFQISLYFAKIIYTFGKVSETEIIQLSLKSDLK